MRTNFLLSLSVLVLITLHLSAQETHFGAKAGVNFSSISSNEPDYSVSMRAGLHIGGGVNLGISDNFSLNVDLLYTQKGAKQETEYTEINNSVTITRSQESKVRLSYIELPVLARYKLESGIYFNGGVYFAFLAGYKDEYTIIQTVNNGNNINTSTESGSSTDDAGIRGTDIGLKLGLGYEFESGLDIGLNYGYGISNIIDIDGWPYNYHNGVISLTVGYWFGK
jgi:hypothetical protein